MDGKIAHSEDYFLNGIKQAIYEGAGNLEGDIWCPVQDQFNEWI